MKNINHSAPVSTMFRSMRCLIFVSFFFICLCLPGHSGAQTLAVMPLLDLTKDKNGVNYILTDIVYRNLDRYDYSLIPENELMSFLVRNRIRTLGEVDAHTMRLLDRDLDADLVLIGTVFQLEVQPAATVSLSLQLVRTNDQKILWTATKDIFEGGLKTLLSLNDPENLNDIYDLLFPELFETFPVEIKLPAEEIALPIDVHTVSIQPDIVSAGSRITCRVRLNAIPEGDGQPVAHIEIDDLLYPADLDEDRHFVAASWPAQKEDGKYPVILVLTWPSGQTESVTLGSYRVDNISTGIRLSVHGKELDGQVAFASNLTMTTGMDNPEQIKMWSMDIYDENNVLVVRHEEAGQIPQRLNWKGGASNGTRLPDGEYRIIVDVWDFAGNHSSAEKKVLLRQEPPAIALTVDADQEQLSMHLANSISTPLVYWWVRISQDNGQVINESDGVSLPVDISFDFARINEDASLKAKVVAMDIVGNGSIFTVPNVLALLKNEESDDADLESQWLKEF